jgi:hypothetical protein
VAIIDTTERFPRYPDIVVRMVGEDGNALSILARVERALRKAGIPEDARAEFRRDATSGDYDHLLQTVMRWVEVE